MKFLFLILLILLVINIYTAIKRKRVPVILGKHAYECGPRCLQIIFRYYGKEVNFEKIAQETEMNIPSGTSLLSLNNCVNNYGFKSLGVKIPFEGKSIKEMGLLNAPLPCIAHINNHYFVVVTKVNKKKVHIIHPESGRVSFSSKEFCNRWLMTQYNENNLGVALLIEKK